MHTYMKTPGNLPVSHELESTEGLTEIQFKGRTAYITNEHDGEMCLTNFLKDGEVSCETLYIVEDTMTDEEYDAFIEEIIDSFVVATQHKYWGKTSEDFKNEAIAEYEEAIRLAEEVPVKDNTTKRRRS